MPPAASPESTLAEVPAAPQTPTVAEPAFAAAAEAAQPQVVSVLPAGLPEAAEEAPPVASLSDSKEPPSTVAETASPAISVPESAEKPAVQPSGKRPSFNRYLVVPERIAMQADAMTQRPALAPAEVPAAEVPPAAPARLQPQRSDAAAGKTTAGQPGQSGQQRQRPGSKGTSPQKSNRVAR